MEQLSCSSPDTAAVLLLLVVVGRRLLMSKRHSFAPLLHKGTGDELRRGLVVCFQ